MSELTRKRIAFLATDMVEQVELTEPWKAVEEAGGTPELVSLEEGEIQGFDHYDKAATFSVDRVVSEVSADDYDGLVLPGGVGNPDTLRMDEDGLISSRNPGDLPAFCRTLVEEFSRGSGPHLSFANAQLSLA